MNHKYNSIILSKSDIGETDRIYTIYTKEAGKIRVRAAGVKKPNAKLAGNLEPLTQSEIFLARSRGRGKITGAIAHNNFESIKENLESTQKVFYVFGIFNRLVGEDEKDEEIFKLLLKYLETIEKVATRESDIKKDIVTLGFLFKFISSLGYEIKVDSCVQCGAPLEPITNYFSAERGGVVCAECAPGILRKVKSCPDAIKLIRIFMKNKIENLNKIDAKKELINNLKTIIKEEIEWIS